VKNKPSVNEKMIKNIFCFYIKKLQPKLKLRGGQIKANRKIKKGGN
jgi:hypothetical protein